MNDGKGSVNGYSWDLIKFRFYLQRNSRLFNSLDFQLDLDNKKKKDQLDHNPNPGLKRDLHISKDPDISVSF